MKWDLLVQAQELFVQPYHTLLGISIPSPHFETSFPHQGS